MNAAQKILANTVALSCCAGLAIAASSSTKEARVTQIIRDVRLLPNEALPRPAQVNDRVAEDTGVRTGGESRSELTFRDLTITRLGANTIFSFNKAGRNVHLDSGSILLRVPKDSGGGAIKTSAVTVAVTGTTLILETSGGGRSKLITLEGGARLSLVRHPRESRYVKAGQMLDVPAGATTLPMPVDIDLNNVMKTHPLITDFPPLPSRDLIVAAAQQQNPPGYSGPSFPIAPIIGDIVGGLIGGQRGGHKNPPSRNPPGAAAVGESAPTPTPADGVTRQPGRTKTPGTTATNAQSTVQPSPSPIARKRAVKKPTPPPGPR
ncbi:MAG: FecR domain-containing protein [Verrucomicrobiota bacterium]